MKQITQGDYQLFLEALPSVPSSDTMLKVWSQWKGAKNPDDLQRRFEATFTIEELDSFIDTLIEFRDAAVVRSAAHQAIEQ
jgi:hypothetical protein